ncbi:MAG: phosphotransferase family protein [Myxococcaceae bacterium]
MEERIRAALQKHGATLKSVKPLHGGACQENFKVQLEHHGHELTLALRSDAASSLPGSIDRATEFSVIEAAVKAGVKTPAPRWLERSLVRDGASAYFLDWVAGEAIGRRVVRNPELEAARQKLPVELAQTLARVHSITPRATPLPLRGATESPARHALDTLRAQLDALPGTYPAVEYALQWLGAHLPAKEEVTLLHGDFRTGNFMVTPDGLSALLDWEFAHWGDPCDDLAWISVRDWRFNRLDKPIGGFAAREPFYAAYEAASGRTIDRAKILWWEICGNLKWAVGSVFQGERYLKGESADLELIAIARRNVEMEFEALRLIKQGSL